MDDRCTAGLGYIGADFVEKRLPGIVEHRTVEGAKRVLREIYGEQL